MENVKIDEKVVEEIQKIIARGKGVEIGVRSGKLIIWEIESKKKYETAITLR